MDGSYIPAIAKTFMNSTRAQVEHENVLVTAASFTFGREALLPSIFMELIKQPVLKVRFKYSRQKLKDRPTEKYLIETDHLIRENSSHIENSI